MGRGRARPAPGRARAADAETEDRLTNLDPGIQGDFRDLDDAAAVVARLLSAVERIDELERLAGGLPKQLEESRREAERRAAEGDRSAEALRTDLQRALAGVPSELDRVEQLARLERLERARLDGESVEAERRQALAAAESSSSRLAARLDQLERDRASAESLADSRLAEAVAAAETRATEAIAESARRFEARLAGGVDVSDQLEQVRAEHEEAAQAARVELAETIARLEREREREREAARAELAAALERVEQVQRGADAVREQLSAVTVERATAQGLAGDDRRRLDELQKEAEALRARVEACARTWPTDVGPRGARAPGGRWRGATRLPRATPSLATRRCPAWSRRSTRPSPSVATPPELAQAVARRSGRDRDAAGGRPAADELDELREAVARHEAAAPRSTACATAHAPRGGDHRPRRAARVVIDSASREDARGAARGAARHADEVAALREAVARHEAAAAEVAALHEAVARHEAASPARSPSCATPFARQEAAAGELAELREAVARQEGTPAEVAELREAVARHEAAAAEIAALREAAAGQRRAVIPARRDGRCCRAA